MTKTNLTATQERVLMAASLRSDGNIEPLPQNVQGGARKKVFDGLMARGLVRLQQEGATASWFINDAGLAAIGKTPAPQPDPELEALVQQVEHQARTRATSKQSAIVQALRAPTGASLNDLIALTGWQAHSVRGLLANLRKQHLDVVSTKDAGVRTYRILQGA